MGYARSLGKLPITYQAAVNGQTLDICTINEDGTITWNIPSETLSQWDVIDPADADDLSFKTPGTAITRNLGVRAGERFNIMDFGAVAGGVTHKLSSRYSTLAAAQAVYPFAVSLNQEIDACALHAMWLAMPTGSIDGNAGPATAKIAYMPPGHYYMPFATITTIADNGGGTILVTTSGVHQLFAGGYCTIGKNRYQGYYQVLSTPSDTTFTVTAAFLGSETGICNLAWYTHTAGMTLVGESTYTTRVRGLELIAAARHSCFGFFELFGTGTFGLLKVRTSRRFGHFMFLHVIDRVFGDYSNGGGDDDYDFCNFRGNWFNSSRHDVTYGSDSTYTGCRFQQALRNNIHKPTGEQKYLGGEATGAAGHNIYVAPLNAGSDAAVECYWNGFTATNAETAAFKNITSVSNNGDGTVTITCDASTYLIPGDRVEHFNTTDYNGTFTVVKTPSDTTYTITASFTSTRTGVMRWEHQRVWRITGSSYLGAGVTEITTDGAHDFVEKLQNIAVITGTSFDGTYSIIARTGANTFTITATTSGSSTGVVAAVDGWDWISDAPTTRTYVNDMRAEGACNFNYMKLNGCYKFDLIARVKCQLLMSAPCARVDLNFDLRGRNSDTYSDIIPSGPHSYYGWSGDVGRDDTDFTDADDYRALVKPHYSSGIGTSWIPTLNMFAMRGDSIDVSIAGSNVFTATAGKLTVNGTLAFGAKTNTGDVAINGYISAQDSAGNAVKLATVA